MELRDKTNRKLRKIEEEIESLARINENTAASLRLDEALDALVNQVEILTRAAQQHQQLQVLRDIDVAIRTSLDLKEVAQLALDRILKELDPSGEFDLTGTLQLLNDAKDTLYDYAGQGVAKDNITVKVGKGVTGLAVARRESILVPDVQSEEWKGTFIDVMTSKTRSELAVLLRSNGDVLGVLNIESPKPNVFKPHHQEFLEVIAGQIVLAIQNAKRYKKIQDDLESLVVIQEITRMLGTTLDLHKVADAILDGALRRLDPTRERKIVGVLQLVDRTSGELQDYAGFGSQKDGKKIPIKIGEGITGLVAQTGRPILADDVRSESWRKIFVDAMATETRSELAVPLKIGAETLGVLNVECPTPNAFRDDDQGFLEVLASIAMVAIQNTRRFERTQQWKIDLERVKAQELQASAYAHRVHNKLGLVPVKVKAIRKLLLETGFQNPKLEEHLKIIDENAQFVSHLTSYFQRVAEISPAGVFDLNQLLEDAVREAKIPSRIKVVTKYSSELPEIETNRVLVEVFIELIANAVKAMHGEGTFEIKSELEGDEWILLSFSDTGHGIKPESLPKIFDMFFTERPQVPDVEIMSTGFGLWWLKAVVVKLGGLVECKSEVNKGTTFYLRLPIEPV